MTPFGRPLSPEAADAINVAVSQRFQHVDNTLKMLQHQLFVRWVVAMVGVLIAGSAAYYAAHQASNNSHQAKTIAIELVYQRRDSILSACKEQNERHDAAIAKLKSNSQNALMPQNIRGFQRELLTIGIKITPIQARHFQILASEQNDSTVQLINALVPHQDCQALINRQAPLSGTHS